MTRKCLDMVKSRRGKWKITMNEMSMERLTRKTFEGEIEGEKNKRKTELEQDGQFKRSYYAPYLNFVYPYNTSFLTCTRTCGRMTSGQ